MSAMTFDHAPHSGPGKSATGWRLLAFFWIALLVIGGVGAGWLEYLGPVNKTASRSLDSDAEPPTGSEKKPVIISPSVESAMKPPAKAVGEAPVTVVAPKLSPASPAVARPGTPIVAPVAAMLEPTTGGMGGVGLPRVVPGLKPPMQTYAGGFDPQDHRPRIGLILSGIGLSDPDSDDAIRLLPAGVTLAVSPYAANPEPLLQHARERGHEFLASIPMEAQGFPLNDEGPHSLLTGATITEMMGNLQWSLSRFAGYAGATGALDGMRGERFPTSDVQMSKMLDEITGRGLYYVDPRPGSKLAMSGRLTNVDLVVDEPPVRAEIVAKFAQLEKLARDRGQALGLAGIPRPVTVAQIAVWSAQLDARGFVLVPVSALLATPPPPVAAAK
jgi:polysaccharide deacetylase 2 family uncharacterized protein YibQ